MNPIPLEPVIEGLSEQEQAERKAYAAWLRRMVAGDVIAEGFYYIARLEDYGKTIGEEPDGAVCDLLGVFTNEARWKRDACLAETTRRRRNDTLPAGAAGLSPEFIERLKGSVDIVAAIEQTGVVLRKSGREYWSVCPFHDERGASFHVNAEKGLYYCHGCNTGGDVIHYLMKFNQEEFIETARRLSLVAGLEMPGSTGAA